MPSPRDGWSGKSLLRFFLEYVGNVDVDMDRRRNHQARILMDRIVNDMARRGVPSHEWEKSVEEIRKTLRAIEPERVG